MEFKKVYDAQDPKGLQPATKLLSYYCYKDGSLNFRTKTQQGESPGTYVRLGLADIEKLVQLARDVRVAYLQVPGRHTVLPGNVWVTTMSSLVEKRKPLPNPTEQDLADPLFEALWRVVKDWDVNIPEYYHGYMSGNGSHVKILLDAVRSQVLGAEERRTAWARIVDDT